MNIIDSLNYYADPDAIAVWWDKPDEAGPGWKYAVSLDGDLVKETDKTHFTFKDLESECDYLIGISVIDAESLVTDKCEIMVKTSIPRKRIDVTASPYNVCSDGSKMETGPLQKAIDECPNDGMVYLPAGTYLTGALKLHSDMELYLDDGAVLLGSEDPKDYLPRIKSRFEGTECECYQSLLNLGELDHTSGPNCRNVIIRGKGTIRGGGVNLAKATIKTERELLKDYLEQNAELVAECENSSTIPGRVRGRLINISNCSNIRISGVTLEDGPSWNVHMIYSDHIITDHCTFNSKGIWNGDGWDPDSSEDCTIFACIFNTGDDCVAIKSGKNPEGNEINRPTKNIRVFDCYSSFGHGLCIGSEMSGGVENVKIWDCDLENSMVGIQVKGTKKRGGYVKNLTVSDCIAPCVQAVSVGYNDDGVSAKEPPYFEDFTYNRLTLTGRSLDKELTDCYAVELEGFDKAHQVRHVLFKDTDILGGLGIRTELCEDVRFEESNSSFDVADQNRP